MDQPNNTEKAPAKPECWTPEAISLLGKISDPAVSARLGVSPSSVAKKRSTLNIPPYAAWPPEMVALLGTDIDIVLAKRIGKSRGCVTNKRISLQIPPFVKANTKPAIIPAEVVEQFGKVPDHQLAALTGYALTTIFKHRIKLGIEAFGVQTFPAEAIALFGKVSDIELAKRYGVSPSSVGRRRRNLGIDAMPAPVAKQLPEAAIAQLGKRTDTAIALEFGLLTQLVFLTRKAMGISVYKKVTWTDEALSLLGTLSDAAIATRLGTNLTNVRQKRLKLGIEPHRPRYVMTPEILALVGTASDTEIARRTGVSNATIGNYRRGLVTLK
jgi:transcriptional regulator with XRE-family HTH domain